MPTRPVSILLLVAACGCTETNLLYCDGARPCPDAARPVCDPVAHVCRAPSDPLSCRAAADCPADHPACDAGHCRTCRGPGDDAACTAWNPATPRCGASGACIACRGAEDDPVCAARNGATPRCGADGTCIACRPDTQVADCRAEAAPICDPTARSCRACHANAECASFACLPDGSCAAVGTVVFVDNGGRTPADCRKGAGTRDGTRADPYCDVQDAVDEKAGRTVVVVAGSAAPYSPVQVTGRKKTLLGPGIAATPSARIAGDQYDDAVYVGDGAEVTMEGLELADAAGYINIARGPDPIVHSGAKCDSAAASSTLVIRHSSIHDNVEAGVSAHNCALTVEANDVRHNAVGVDVRDEPGVDAGVVVDANRIHGNLAVGVRIAGAPFVITNNVVAENSGKVGGGVRLDSYSTGTFAFNTVANNSNEMGDLGGIDCGYGAPKSIAFSIVWGNTARGGTQLAGTCTLDSVVTGPDVAPQAIRKDPTFVDPMKGDYHLKANDPANAACCVDQATPPDGLANRGHDIDSSRRPRGAAWDLGAHEVQ